MRHHFDLWGRLVVLVCVGRVEKGARKISIRTVLRIRNSLRALRLGSSNATYDNICLAWPLHGSLVRRLLLPRRLSIISGVMMILLLAWRYDGGRLGEEVWGDLLTTVKVGVVILELILRNLRCVLEEVLKVVLLDTWVIQGCRTWRLPIMKPIVLQMNLYLLLLARAANYFPCKNKSFEKRG